MTQKEKGLLLQDLGARLSYEVKVDHFGAVKELLGIIPSSENVMVGYDINDYEDSVIEDIKPYLRPMSSMTDEEMKEYNKTRIAKFIKAGSGYRYDGWWEYYDTATSFDYLNANHFDYRGLIPKGLAIEAPKEMYKKEE